MRSPLNVSAIASREQATPIDPRSEISRNGHVGRGGDDVSGKRRVAARKLVEQRSKTNLRRHRRLNGDRKLLRYRNACRLQTAFARGRERHAVEKGLNVLHGLAHALERGPFVTPPDVHRGAEGFHLRRRHQPGMVVLMARERQAKPFDRVSDEADRPVVIDPIEGVDDRRQIVAAEIAHETRQFIVAARLNKSGDRSLIADLIQESLAPCRAALEYQRRV